jgi:hypothetical protein
VLVLEQVGGFFAGEAIGGVWHASGRMVARLQTRLP